MQGTQNAKNVPKKESSWLTQLILTELEILTCYVITGSLLLISIGWCLLKAPSAPAAVLQNLEVNTTNGVWITTM